MSIIFVTHGLDSTSADISVSWTFCPGGWQLGLKVLFLYSLADRTYFVLTFLTTGRKHHFICCFTLLATWGQQFRRLLQAMHSELGISPKDVRIVALFAHSVAAQVGKSHELVAVRNCVGEWLLLTLLPRAVMSLGCQGAAGSAGK